MDDNIIIGLYFERDEKAIAETENKYGRYCRYIAKNILGSDEEARQIENDTYLKIWNTVPPESPVSLKSYAGMISRTLAINEYNKYETKKRKCNTVDILNELSECIPDKNAEFSENFELRLTLDSFISSLEEEKRNIFLKRYFYAMTVNEIASELSISRSSVKMTLHRLRQKLREHLSKEGIEI